MTYSTCPACHKKLNRGDFNKKTEFSKKDDRTQIFNENYECSSCECTIKVNKEIYLPNSDRKSDRKHVKKLKKSKEKNIDL
jgi:hypothetical protein